jgi:hypothetical protein
MAGETNPELQRIEQAKQFLDEVFPDALLIAPANVDGAVRQRMDEAGLGLAEILLEDGSVQLATYTFADTPITGALARIWEDEQAGELPLGSHDSAIDCIISDEFYQQWASYLPW